MQCHINMLSGRGWSGQFIEGLSTAVMSELSIQSPLLPAHTFVKKATAKLFMAPSLSNALSAWLDRCTHGDFHLSTCQHSIQPADQPSSYNILEEESRIFLHLLPLSNSCPFQLFYTQISSPYTMLPHFLFLAICCSQTHLE